MLNVGKKIDDWYIESPTVKRRHHSFQNQMVGDSRANQCVITRQCPRDVLSTFASIDADLIAANRDRMTAKLHDGHLHGVARSRGRMLEEQCRSFGFKDALP